MNVKYFLHIFGPKTLKGAVGVPQSGTRIWQKAIFKHALGTLRGMDIPVFSRPLDGKKAGFP